MTHSASRVRAVTRILDSVERLEGEGFLVHRPFPSESLADFDPFLLLDEMGPMDFASGQAKGAPDHPHRGLETVTYMLSGRFEHKDSHGHVGILNCGDVQYMNAGGGLVHSEMPEKEFVRTGGRLHAVQLWINLSRRDKMMQPRYQEIRGANIRSAQTPDGKVTVKVIAGESLGSKATLDTQTPILYLHFYFQPGGKITQPIPKAFNAFAYIVDGEGLFGADHKSAKRGQVVLFGQDGDVISIEISERSMSPLNMLLIGGRPLHEPIARYGPFVMNTQTEICQAVEDYQSGKMGTIKD